MAHMIELVEKDILKYKYTLKRGNIEPSKISIGTDRQKI